jgi:hypothetical protein
MSDGVDVLEIWWEDLRIWQPNLWVALNGSQGKNTERVRTSLTRDGVTASHLHIGSALTMNKVTCLHYLILLAGGV